MLRAINETSGHASRLHAEMIRHAPKDRIDDYNYFSHSLHKGLLQLGTEYQTTGSIPSNLLHEVAGGVHTLSQLHRVYCGEGGENTATVGHVEALDKAAEGITHDNYVETPDFTPRWVLRRLH